MRLSKQERIGALIILAIVILALGAFLLIKPKFEEVGRTQATLTQRQTELKQAQDRQALKGGLRTQIEAEYEEGEHLADMFFPELNSYETENAFRAFMQQLEFPVVVESVSVEQPTTESLSVSFYTPSEVTYALKTYVTQGITEEATEDEVKNAARLLALMASLSEPQTIGASKLTFTASFLKQEDVLKFVDAVNEYLVKEEGSSDPVRKALMINTLSIPYNEVVKFYSKTSEDSMQEISRIGRNYMREDGFHLENPNPETPVTPDNPDNPDNPNNPEEEEDGQRVYTYSDTITFLSIERMQDPKAQLDAQDGVGQ